MAAHTELHIAPAGRNSVRCRAVTEGAVQPGDLRVNTVVERDGLRGRRRRLRGFQPRSTDHDEQDAADEQGGGHNNEG